MPLPLTKQLPSKSEVPPLTLLPLVSDGVVGAEMNVDELLPPGPP